VQGGAGKPAPLCTFDHDSSDFACQLRCLARSTDWLPVGQTLASDAFEGAGRAGRFSDTELDAVVVAEVELRDVAVQVPSAQCW
jgi:hypothetical protein